MKVMIDNKLIDYLKSLKQTGSLEWVSQMKELISYDDHTEDLLLSGYVKCGNLHIDGQLGGDGWLQIDDISGLKTLDDVSFFPSLTDQAGKSVVVNDDETGFEYLGLSESEFDIGDEEQSHIFDLTNRSQKSLTTIVGTIDSGLVHTLTLPSFVKAIIVNDENGLLSPSGLSFYINSIGHLVDINNATVNDIEFVSAGEEGNILQILIDGNIAVVTIMDNN